VADTTDQVFVSLQHWLVGMAPGPWRPVLSAVISVAAIIVVFAGLFAITTVLERKGLGRIQNRYGPNRVGPWGLLQPLADGLKALTKEDLVPTRADRIVHFLAPLVLVLPAFLALSVLPVGRNMVAVDLDAGVLFFFAAGAATELSVFMAGWSSRNKYSLLGAMRAIAQMISYEVPLILSSIAVVMAVGSLSTVSIVAAQSGYSGLIPHWHVLTPWGLAGFVLFMIAAAAESNRSPFDLPEGESEIIAGYYIEYSGFKFALFFLGEYIGMFAVSGLAITLFLGGWHAPLAFLTVIPSYVWFFSKLLALIGVFIWVRGTLPRLRMDQLMNFAWKFMLPLSLANIFVTGIWRYLGPGWVRWLVCGALILTPYVVLARSLAAGKQIGRRIYRYAE
jgi:NADH-quinone oxidoreductase subunit H